MSYLSPLRLHFAGKFQADVSTVNNDVRHYDNANFKPEYQLPQTSRAQWNGWWNPRGTASWRPIDCNVTSAVFADGSPAPDDDPVLTMEITGANDRVAGKLVDLDPQQQLVSEIWGLMIRIAHGDREVLRGEFQVTPFTDIWWSRGSSGGGAGGDSAASAVYQSVLTDVEWGDVSDSPFLQALKDAPGNRLSIKFNVDQYVLDSRLPNFTIGRIVGTIGPAGDDEPAHFVVGRQLMPAMQRSVPVNDFNFAQGVVDAERKKVLFDFGNALPTASSGLHNIGDLQLGIYRPNGPGRQYFPLGAIDYLSSPDWYESTAGVQEFPADRTLTDEELQALDDNPLVVVVVDGNQGSILVQESVGGYYIRADQFVHRLNPGQSVPVRLIATRYGKRLGGAEVLCSLDNSGLQPGGGQPSLGPTPAFGTPASALHFDHTLTTHAETGEATLNVQADSPGNPRGYIDGQVYGIGYTLAAIRQGSYNPNPSNFISVLAFDHDEIPDQPTWWQDARPILLQAANLYPRMGDIVHLGDYDSVVKHRKILELVFSLDPKDPNYMPVTRDLSDAKRDMLLKWLRADGPDGKPLLGTPPDTPVAALAASVATPADASASVDDTPPPKHVAFRDPDSVAGRTIDASELG